MNLHKIYSQRCANKINLKMDHEKIAKTSLKLLNLIFAILMLIVAFSNTELITHNKRIYKPDVLTAKENDQKILLECEKCQNQALSILTTLNGEFSK